MATLADWKGFSNAELRLRCGELTAQEIRTVRAVLNAIEPPNAPVADLLRELIAFSYVDGCSWQAFNRGFGELQAKARVILKSL